MSVVEYKDGELDAMQNKGTVIYFGYFEMPDRNAAAHRVLNIGKILRDLGYKVCFCGIDKEIVNMEAKPLDMGGGFYSWPKPYPKCGKEWMFDLLNFDFYKNCIEYFDNVKYVLCYDPHAIPFKNIIKYCNKKKIKVVADVTEWYENRFSLMPEKFFRWIDTLLVMRFYLKKIDRMIVISRYLADYYSKYVDKIALVPPLVDFSEPIWHQTVSEEKTKLCRFVYAGNTDKHKDKLDIILEAFTALKEKSYELRILGLTEDDFRQKFPKKVELLDKMPSQISFKGHVSHFESIKTLLESSCSLIIRDSTRKNNAGFPTKFVEAVTAGLMIISTNVSDVAEYKEVCSLKLIPANSIKPNVLQTVLVDVMSHNTTQRKTKSDLFSYERWKHAIEAIL